MLGRRTLSFTPSARFMYRVLRVRARIVSGDLIQQADRAKPDRKMSYVAQRLSPEVETMGVI
jgi:hypothetical protein